MLGLFALNSQGIQGAILQMVNHGLSTGALFLLVGMIYEQTHTREIKSTAACGRSPRSSAIMTLIVALSSMGLPGLNGFVGEFTILLGAWGAGMRSRVRLGRLVGRPFGAGVILAAIYMLFMFQKMFLGPGSIVEESRQHGHSLRDLNWREIAHPPAPAGLHLLDRPVPQALLRPDGPQRRQLVAALLTPQWRCHRRFSRANAFAERWRCTES
jgi:NADH-quinone oxidoreductase subunit M